MAMKSSCVLLCIFTVLCNCAPLNQEIHVFCDVCVDFVDGLQKLFELHLTEDAIAKAAIEMCVLFKVEDHYICSAIVPEFKVIIDE